MNATHSYYECHVTFLPAPTTKQHIIEHLEDRGWRFSAIDGDIVEGAGVKWYATRHYNIDMPHEAVMQRLFALADWLTAAGVEVTRRKIEHVIYDDRSNKICPPSCVECLLLDAVLKP